MATILCGEMERPGIRDTVGRGPMQGLGIGCRVAASSFLGVCGENSSTKGGPMQGPWVGCRVTIAG